MSPIDDELVKRIHRDLQDDFDEELELELEDRDHGVAAGDAPADEADQRKRYFRELFQAIKTALESKQATATGEQEPEPEAGE